MLAAMQEDTPAKADVSIRPPKHGDAFGHVVRSERWPTWLVRIHKADWRTDTSGSQQKIQTSRQELSAEELADAGTRYQGHVSRRSRDANIR